MKILEKNNRMKRETKRVREHWQYYWENELIIYELVRQWILVIVKAVLTTILLERIGLEVSATTALAIISC